MDIQVCNQGNGMDVEHALNQGTQEEKLNLGRVREEMLSWPKKRTMTVTHPVPALSLSMLLNATTFLDNHGASPPVERACLL